MKIPCNQCHVSFKPKNGLRDWICPECANQNKLARIAYYKRVRRERDMMKRMVMSYE